MKERLKAIEERLNAASPGPWEHEPGDSSIEAASGGTVCCIQHHGSIHTFLSTGEEYSHADGEFIANAPKDISFLLACVDALGKETSAIHELITACRKLREAHDERWERTKKLQELATQARQEGRSLSHLVDNPPRVWDIGNVCDDILAALKKVERERRDRSL